MTPKRVVLDTNALINRLLSRRSVPAQAMDLATTLHRILASEATLMELAVEGAADIVVTGDGDLLALNPFRGCAIVTPAQFLEM